MDANGSLLKAASEIIEGGSSIESLAIGQAALMLARHYMDSALSEPDASDLASLIIATAVGDSEEPLFEAMDDQSMAVSLRPLADAYLSLIRSAPLSPERRVCRHIEVLRDLVDNHAEELAYVFCEDRLLRARAANAFAITLPENERRCCRD